MYVAWYDDDVKGVHLASGANGTSFEPLDTPGTEGGAFPSLAVTSDRSGSSSRGTTPEPPRRAAT